MARVAKLTVYSIIVSCALIASASAQSLEIKRYNSSEWTKGRFSEIVTVNGPGKTIGTCPGSRDQDGYCARA